MIEDIRGAGELRLHRPEPREVVPVVDPPWEGNTSAYFTLFRDGEPFRMYYRRSHFNTGAQRGAHRELTCYAESKDGIYRTKPDLGLFEFDGSAANNIVWDGPGTHNFTPFRDSRPGYPSESRYKALALGDGGLLAFQSADGIHWKPIRAEPIITEGAFDSQNPAFWDGVAGRYRAYRRIFKEGVRDIRAAMSRDFVTWEPWEDLDYGGARREHLYTIAVLPYFRAEHVLIGFRTRFPPDTQQVKPYFMSSRDGRHWRLWPHPVIPRAAPRDRDGNRSNYMAWGLLSLPGQDRELSVYGWAAYYAGPASRLRRFVHRTDGFVSFHAEEQPAELRTKAIAFTGKALMVNYAVRPGGFLRVELPSFEGSILRGDADCGLRRE